LEERVQRSSGFDLLIASFTHPNQFSSVRRSNQKAIFFLMVHRFASDPIRTAWNRVESYEEYDFAIKNAIYISLCHHKKRTLNPISILNMFSHKLAAASKTLLSGNKSLFYSSTTAMGKKVAVLGAAGGIGQPLSLLLKLSPLITELSCYDIVGTPGVAADLSHIPSAAHVTGHVPSSGTWPPSHNTGLEAALTGASVVVIPAGVPRKPGMTRDDLFNTNAGVYIL
jgi:hypothetical protein